MRYIDECALKKHKCQQNCTNTIGNYSCSCYHGYKAVGNYTCISDEDDVNKASIVFAIATCAGLGVLLVLAATWWLCKVVKRRKIRKLKEKNFERNGGLLLHQQVSSSEGHVDATLFTSKALEMATDRYSKDRILGQGGQGTVYKGMLTDGRIVAVKKSKIEDESKKEQFINEVVLLSKINHRNIVKLHGYCLETEVPLLVYEFIPNGTLYVYIHDHSEDFPLTWDIRVRLAIEIAGSLFYLHSAASIPIFHRDIKSSNILLDEKYRAKLADFGTSKSIAIDQTHLTTRVQGLKPILAPRAHDEGRSLATHFILTMKENRIFDILDPRIAKEGKREEITTFSNIAYRCLNLNGRKRPTMKQITAELESINLSNRLPNAEEYYVKDLKTYFITRVCIQIYTRSQECIP
ncbi:wall-associated receptor kinase-like 2 [Heracleum sosnowskyi]|uniref:Wall-associated receptor kinase-like 2 n=1 Tax=Heracleum sosnowskyi TaxID=360622 RepID=A0AAD8JE11_9APIA|nr:wall-associated receptor kinase-like 2 [Heracleum sosnowskyi]